MKRFVKIALLVFFVFATIICVLNNRKPEFETDAERFKYEYEVLNGKQDDYGGKIRELAIPEENPMVYETYLGIIERMEKKETFAVYFGYSKCPWCRGALDAILRSAVECNVSTIYYVDVYKSRDLYELKDGKAIKRKSGEDGYERLLEMLDPVLLDYELLDENDEKICVGEKRIYAPNLIAVKAGEPVEAAADSALFTDPYGVITEEIFRDMKQLYKNLFYTLG